MEMIRSHTSQIVLALALSLVLASPGTILADCSYSWRPGESVPGVSGTVRAITTWDPDGGGPQPELIVVGGAFTLAGNTIVKNIAAWNGSSWLPLGTGTNFDVFALTVYNGSLIAGGSFTTA